MRKLLLLSVVIFFAGATSATSQLAFNVRQSHGAVFKRAFVIKNSEKALVAKADGDEDSGIDAYYTAPDGVLYLGLDKKAQQPSVDYVLVPNNAPIIFKSGFNDGDYTWDYYNDESENLELEDEDLTLTLTGEKVIEAPSLYCVGYGGRGSYTMSHEGMAVGYGYIPGESGFEYYGSNINSNELNGLFYDPGNLSVNYADANTAMDKYYSTSGLTIKGFGEEFSYAGPYTLDGVRADVVYGDGTTPELSQLVAEVYPCDGTGVDFTKKLATYTAKDIVNHDDEFNNFTFTTDNAPLITTPVMVIIRTSEDCKSIISPAECGSELNHAAEKGTSYMYFSKDTDGASKDVCLPYYNVELEGYRNVNYLKHWNVSIKRTYKTEESGIKENDTNHGDVVSVLYTNLSGERVSEAKSGFNIKTVTFRDGTVKSTKFMK